MGRGSRRGGGRILPEQMTILRTRPESVTSKKGEYKKIYTHIYHVLFSIY